MEHGLVVHLTGHVGVLEEVVNAVCITVPLDSVMHGKPLIHKNGTPPRSEHGVDRGIDFDRCPVNKQYSPK